MFTFPESFIEALKVENNVTGKRALIPDSEVKELSDLFKLVRATKVNPTAPIDESNCG